MAVPPLIKCSGIHVPSARAANGVYEFQGTVWGRPCYHQAGISSGNHVWFAQEAYQGPMWVITPKLAGVGEAPTEVLAMSRSLARWPWEVDNWMVCSPHGSDLVAARNMRFNILNPVAEIEVQYATAMGLSVARFRCAGDVNERPAYRRVHSEDGIDQRLFFMPKMGRWLLADLKEDGGGIQTIVARSHFEDGTSWASLWPWGVEQGGWEKATCPTMGLQLGDAVFEQDKDMRIRMISPNIYFTGLEGAPIDVQGIYEGRGMTNGRIYYLQQFENALSEKAGSLALWFAEDRGQWVITDADKLGDSTQVVARIASRAWWPWEAHLASTSSPALLGAAMLAAMPPWQEGAALLASLRPTWEMSDERGKFRKLKDMGAQFEQHKYAHVTAGEGAQHKFVGNYSFAGLLSSRPFFVQDRKNRRKCLRFALWYAEDVERWVITKDYRLLDGNVVDARVDDSAWFPWDVNASWEVADGQGDFVPDILLRVTFLKEAPRKRKKQKSALEVPSLVSDEVQSVVSGAGTNDEDEDEEEQAEAEVEDAEDDVELDA
mmetsp:Transcript_40615/g.63570  ORF Transcript_40615/g.63570 Transcript_40615/m.63570 type:complete len:547 (+) Transcript_40615:79-1719(+)